MKKIVVFLVAMVVGLAFMAGAAVIAPEEKAAIEKVAAFHFPGRPVSFEYVAATDTIRIVVGDIWQGIYAEYEANLTDGWVREVWYRPNFRGTAAKLFEDIFSIINAPARQALGAPKELRER